MDYTEVVDIACLYDLDETGALVYGADSLKQDLYHRLITPEGSLAYVDEDAADYGYGLDRLIGVVLDDTGVTLGCSRVQAECLKDERVFECQVSGVFQPDTQTLTLTIRATPNDGEDVELLLAVSDVTVELLNP